MDIKCLAFDIDGTLTTDKKIIDPRTKKSIEEAMDRGIHIVISSGRNKESCEFVYKPLGLEKGNHFLSLVNGQQIYDFQKNQFYNDRLLSIDECKEIQRVCQKYRCIGRFSKDNHAYYMVPFTYIVRLGIQKAFKNNTMMKGTKYKNQIVFYNHKFNETINKVIFMKSKEFFEKNLSVLKEELKDFDLMMVDDNWMEIMPKGVNKASSLKKIASMNGFGMENIMAFGDADNDIDMLKAAGIGVCMGNGRDSVKAIADIITDSNNDNGIGKVIDKYVLEKNEW